MQDTPQTSNNTHISYLPKETPCVPDDSHSYLTNHSSNMNSGNYITIDEASITSSSSKESNIICMRSHILDATIEHQGIQHWQNYKRNYRSHKNSTPIRRGYANRYSQRQQSKNNNNVIIGKGESTGIRAINNRTRLNHANKNITGTFISRLDPKITSRDLAIHIHREFGLTVRPEKLFNRSGLCSSFYIPGNRAQRQSLMNADMWPKGTLLKPFVQY